MASLAWAAARTASFLLHRSGALAAYSERQRITHGHRCAVIFYHRVSDDDLLYRDIVVSRETFRSHLEYLSEQGFEFLSLEQHHDYLAGRLELTSDSVLITFDDGYRDNFTEALPVMRDLGVPATVFVCSGPIDGGEPLWWDAAEDSIRGLRTSGVTRLERDVHVEPEIARLVMRCLRAPRNHVAKVMASLIDHLKTLDPGVRGAALEALGAISTGVRPDDRMLTWDMVRAMGLEGVSLGAHSVTHPEFSRLSADEARTEVRDCMDRIERNTGVSVTSFAYPYGKSGSIGEGMSEVLSECGIGWAYTTENGFDGPPADRLRLHRLGMRDVPDYVLAARLSGIFEGPAILALRRIFGIAPG